VPELDIDYMEDQKEACKIKERREIRRKIKHNQ
jgi:hypothetical protein